MTTEPDSGSAKGRQRGLWWLLGAVLLAGAGVVVIWFQPQKLLLDERVDETLPPLPTVARPASPPGDSTAPPPDDPGPQALAIGSFVSLDHPTTGAVRVVRLADGSRIVRLDELMTDNGPDLFLYMSTNPADGDEGAFDDEFINLGRLKGNQGNQNYELPDAVDLGRYSTLVIWCDRFNSAFGAATLEPT